ncbi:hypothetical protein K493DRAFT_302719 [Basidiobolus meristosporus CBS 931.73]|uniref:F-box domain-containing protein n=1 Tax=Basidiobolus meristosporus CBS 931.73 TaxID=1314790 RepID=A0A1Y1Y5S6_9FUNG|nr:hypothetical protein K493DRAFT_302719 [Basidiobolus meristosporus CBS 931.73]|eukprot:ORX93353.1 hypothetical protein K493DRAFT_302719 [Basidiobolus meristosporus CBS 931.73]
MLLDTRTLNSNNPQSKMTTKPFPIAQLPLEIIHMIVLSVTDWGDVCSLRSSCEFLNEALDNRMFVKKWYFTNCKHWPSKGLAIANQLKIPLEDGFILNYVETTAPPLLDFNSAGWRTVYDMRVVHYATLLPYALHNKLFIHKKQDWNSLHLLVESFEPYLIETHHRWFAYTFSEKFRVNFERIAFTDVGEKFSKKNRLEERLYSIFKSYVRGKLSCYSHDDPDDLIFGNAIW